MSLAFKVSGVYKHYKDVKALNGVSLEAPEGTIFGLLGPNGAGKTTLVRALSTLLRPDKGNLEVLGVDVMQHPREVRQLIGLAGQNAAVDEYLTGRENLEMVGSLYHLPKKQVTRRAEDILGQLHLKDVAKRQVRTYSGGLRRRLDLGASLVGQPKILFLDEPTTGLDPQTRQDLWQIIRNLVAEGTSILLTTQYLEEADELADKIAVLDRGKVIAEGTSAQLKAKLGGELVEFRLGQDSDWPKARAALTPLKTKRPSYDNIAKIVRVPVGQDGSKLLLAIVRALDNAGVEPLEISLHRPSLDDVFLRLTGQKASDVAKKRKKSGHTRRIS